MCDMVANDGGVNSVWHIFGNGDCNSASLEYFEADDDLENKLTFGILTKFLQSRVWTGGSGLAFIVVMVKSKRAVQYSLSSTY